MMIELKIVIACGEMKYEIVRTKSVEADAACAVQYEGIP